MISRGKARKASLRPSRQNNIDNVLNLCTAVPFMLLLTLAAIKLSPASNILYFRDAAGHINQAFEIEQGIQRTFSPRLTLLVVNVYFRQSH